MSQLFFKKRFQDAIRAGTKSTTIRRWDKPRVRVGARSFCPGLGWLTIESVDEINLAALRASDAAADGFATLTEMKQLLHEMYPDHASDGKAWFRVRFRLHALFSKANSDGGDHPRLF